MNRLILAREYEKEHLCGIKDEERPVYHVSPATGWLNDPNGFSFFDGEYHLFYQYYPFAARWGTMHWGHCTSDDMVRWRYKPAALAPDEPYESGCYSGSAAETPDGKHLLMYTAHLEQEREPGNIEIQETQCVAVGDGTDYVKYGENPVLTAEDLPPGGSRSDFRDPKIWIENGRYYSVIANMAADGAGQLLLYSSPDGYRWEYVRILEKSGNELGEMWECPDFFHLGEKAVIIVSPMNMKAQGLEFHGGHNVLALVGQCPGDTFEFTREFIQNVDHGFDFYAAQTMETEDGRRIMIAWMQSWAASACQPANAKWFCMMSFPRELMIRNGRLVQNPIRELGKYRKNPVIFHDYIVDGFCEPKDLSGRIADIEICIRECGSENRHFDIYMAAENDIYTVFRCDFGREIITVDRSRSGLRHDIVCERKFRFAKKDGGLKLRFLIDRFSIELFVNDGEQAFSMCIYDTPLSADRIRFFSDRPTVIDVEKYEIAV